MKLKFYGGNIDVTLTNTAGEPIYTYQVDSLDVELDIAKLIEFIDEIKQAVFAIKESTPPEA